MQACSNSFLSLEGWKSATLIFTVLGWTFGALTILSGIAVYVANTNIDALKAAPRAIEHPPALYPHMKVKSPPISIITFGYGEPESYTSEMISALNAADFEVRPPMHVGFRPGAPSGVTVVPNGHDAAQLMKSLDQADIKYTISQQLHVPASALQSVADLIVLEIGAK